MSLPPFETLVPMILVIFLAIGLHEYAHCALADAAGDPTPRFYGRVTLNLTKHFEPMGTIMMILSSVSGYGLGWGKAAPMDSRKMRNPRWDLFAAVAAGPISNVLQAVVYALILRLVYRADVTLLYNEPIRAFLYYGVVLNLGLAFFNLIPFGPLDGHWLVGQMLPEKPRHYWYRFHRNVGKVGLFAALMILQVWARSGGPNVLEFLVHRPLEATFQFLTGLSMDNLDFK